MSTLRVVVRRVLAGLLIWLALAAWATRPQPPVDCYEVMPWNGFTFTSTGEFKCLQ